MRISTKFYPYREAEDHLFSATPYSVVRVGEFLWTSDGYLSRLGVEVLWWMVNNTKPDHDVLHETEDGSISADNIYTPSPNRFYFSDREQALAFAEVLPEFDRMGDSFFRMADQKEGQLAGFIKYYIRGPSTGFSKDEIAVNFWCRRNLIGRVYREDGILLFEKMEDCALFKLTFCGKEVSQMDVDKMLYQGGKYLL